MASVKAPAVATAETAAKRTMSWFGTVFRVRSTVTA
jgi:hypothetical protein